MRRAWTTEELRAMSDQLDRPPYPPFLIDQIKAALLYAADLIDAADDVVRKEAAILGSARRRVGIKNGVTP